mmetsp:Transcript_19602/g.42845  ORF Transcript_19602/g.42845 Transcript_19602/m.42845 type:complete len:370 (-) Transcript_19602:111-1220(-)
MAPVDDIIAFCYGAGERGKGVDEQGRRRLQQPRGIRLGADGSLLVADFGNHCILRFGKDDLRGTVVAGEEGKMLPVVDPLKDIDRPLGAPEGEGRLLKRPVDVWEEENGILVLDCDACRVQSFDKNQSVARTIVPFSEAAQKSVHVPEALKYPRSIVREPDGSLLVCDTWSHRVLRYAANDTSGKPELVAGVANSCGQRPDQLAFPSAIALAPDGSLLVADTNNHRIQRFEAGSSSGTTVAGSESGLPGSGLGELNMPSGLCVHPGSGSILVADRKNSRVMLFPAGSQAGAEGQVVAGREFLQRPWGLSMDAEGFLYVSDERNARVLKLEVTEFPIPRPARRQPERLPAATCTASPPSPSVTSLSDCMD